MLKRIDFDNDYFFQVAMPEKIRKEKHLLFKSFLFSSIL